MSNPIPAGLRAEFKAFMEMHDHDDLSDGAWFACLEDAAQQFMDNYKLNKKWMCNNDAAHQYLRLKG